MIEKPHVNCVKSPVKRHRLHVYVHMKQLCGATLNGQRAVNGIYILELRIKAQIFHAVLISARVIDLFGVNTNRLADATGVIHRSGHDLVRHCNTSYLSSCERKTLSVQSMLLRKKSEHSGPKPRSAHKKTSGHSGLSYPNKKAKSFEQKTGFQTPPENHDTEILSREQPVRRHFSAQERLLSSCIRSNGLKTKPFAPILTASSTRSSYASEDTIKIRAS
ncbi:hypothetical protein SDC9_98326 [bioreactor metagenome]|uniref:Uncharacterized protein n=1 Tax=bioreactor metagenome TaxID=1076179 RepID=A0A645AEX3_9ZZZZ